MPPHHVRLIALATLASLVAPTLSAQPAATAAAHRTGFFHHDGARLHYLEWPGSGSPVVLLPGYALTAHVFDDIAPRLAATHRVIALTPRGFGESDAPDGAAYTIDALVGDLRALLDSLRIPRATLVAHSLSGTVAARLALQSPERVTRLILLDAYPYADEEPMDSIDALNPVPMPAFVGDTSYATVAAYLARYRFVPWQPALLADLHAKPLEPEASRRRRLTAGYIRDQSVAPPALSQLAVPSVQLCAMPTTASEYPWLPEWSPAFRAADRYTSALLVPLARRLCTRYARTVPLGETIIVAGSHYAFFTHPARTATLLARLLR